MMIKTRIGFGLLLLTSLSAACARHEEIGCTEQGSSLWNNGLMWSNGVLWSNGLWSNGLWHNGLWTNGLWGNGLDATGLSAIGVGGDEELDFACNDQALQVIEYSVGCALREDQSIDVLVGGIAHTIHGKIGLAPTWADGTCDDTCQGWVSACLLASINAEGEHVAIAIEGDHPALGEDSVPGFTEREATYYGNLFVDPVEMHACLAPGVATLSRSCDGRADCPIEIAGRCGDVCDSSGCRDRDGNVFEQWISVSLRPDPIAIEDLAPMRR